jgi:hypothetical protein
MERDVWEDAVYTEDRSFGEGAKTFTLEIKVKEHLVTFTVSTDKSTVGDALLELGLISGDMGQYGIYVKNVNGMTADFDVDGSYWALYINGSASMNGASTVEIKAGEIYRFEYTK